MYFFIYEVKNINCYDANTGHQYNVDNFDINNEYIWTPL